MRFVPFRGLLVWSLLVPLGCAAREDTRQRDTQPVAPSIHVDLQKSVTYLASDELEGRRIGTPGINKAGDYIASIFSQLRLSPLPGLSGCFQPFTMTTGAKVGDATSLQSDGKSYVVDKDFVPVSFSASKKFSGSVVFAGYGISKSDGSYDDYKRLDVKGKVVLAMRYEPHNENGTSRFAKDDWSDDAHLDAKARTAAAHGAVALLLVDPPTYHESKALMPFAREFLGETASIPVLQLTQQAAGALLQRGDADDLKTLQAKIDAAEHPASVPLEEVSVSGNIAVDRIVREVKNIVAFLPGKGPLADEYVVIGAHYDHLGMGGQGSRVAKPGDIHHGADDNASGTSVMIALAEHYAYAGPQARSMIFVAFTAEEEGLIGSQRFVTHCPVPIEKIAAMVNLDMVGRVRSGKLYVGGSGTAASFEKILKKADDDSPLSIRTIGKGGFGPSDHMSFAMQKVPVLFLFSGLHTDYHRPTDVATKINYAGLQQVVNLTTEILDLIVAMPREQYVSTSDVSMPKSGGSGASVTLGVVPDYSTEESEPGVRIQGTVPGSPAAAAGLKEGDVIVQFGTAKIQTLYDLSDQLAKGKPGEKVHLLLVRGGEHVEVDAVLVERKG